MSIDFREWENLVSKYPDAHLLQLASWGDFKAKFGWEVCRIQQQDSGAQILFRKLPLGLCWGYIAKGPVGDEWESVWPYVEAECRRRRAVFLKVEPDIGYGDPQELKQRLRDLGCHPSQHHIQPWTTLVVDLTGGEEEVLARMKQKTRYNIRLARRKGVVVEAAEGRNEQVEAFYNLMEITGSRDGFGIHSQAYYQKAYEIFWPAGQCELFVAHYDGGLLAGVMVFATGKRAWYFYGASSDEQRNLMAPYAAQWAAMQWARSKGCLEYDLWGIPDEDLESLEAEFTQRQDGLWGVYRFKRGFGGRIERSPGACDRVFNRFLYLFYLFWMKKSQT